MNKIRRPPGQGKASFYIVKFNLYYLLRLEKRLVSMEPAEVAVLLVVVVVEEVDFFSFDRRPEAAVVATDEVIEDASSDEREESVESTLEELSVVTRFWEPEMRLLRKEVFVDSLVVVSIPLALLTIVTMLAMFVVLVRSSLPSDLY